MKVLLVILSLLASQSSFAKCLFKHKASYVVDREVHFAYDDLKSTTAQDLSIIGKYLAEEEGYDGAPFSAEAVKNFGTLLNPSLEYLTSNKTHERYVYAYSFPGENEMGVYYELKTMKPVAYIYDTSFASCDIAE